jgi:hypothetical protein
MAKLKMKTKVKTRITPLRGRAAKAKPQAPRRKTIAVTDEMVVAGVEYLRGSGRMVCTGSLEADLSFTRGLLGAVLALYGEPRLRPPRRSVRVDANGMVRDPRQCDMDDVWGSCHAASG